MERECWKCKTIFRFKKDDIKTVGHEQKRKRTIKRSVSMYVGFLCKTKYTGIETYTVDKYFIVDSVVGCPACGGINTLHETEGELVEKGPEMQRTVDENGMFGPNHPAYCGNDPIFSWMSKCLNVT